MTIESKTLKRGDVHPVTGLLYYGRRAWLKDGQYWVTTEHFDRLRIAARDDTRRRRQNPAVRKAESEYYQRPAVRARYAAIRKTAERRTYIRDWTREKNSSDPLANLRARCRQRIASAIKAKRLVKCRSTADTLGCSWPFLKSYLETRFLPGMTWENFSEWQIDHDKPIASAKTAKQLLRLCHFSNLVPMWKRDNMAKSDKVWRQQELAV